MAITFKKSKLKSALPMNPVGAEVPPIEQPLTRGLDTTNRAHRTPIGWIVDPSPSMEGFTQTQLTCAKTLVTDLRRTSATAQTVLLNITQIGTPPPSTGFVEIESFEVPPLVPATSTPLHLAIDSMREALGRLFADFRTNGIDRTDSVVIITTDGYANGCSTDELNACIRHFLDLGKKWSVTNIVVGVGERINDGTLKSLTNGVPPIRIDELNAACLTPFIQRIAEQVSQSRPGQRVELELPHGAEPIE